MDDGLLVLEGRSSEVINSGGVKRAPELVEEIVNTHPAVVESATFGEPGADGIEEIALAIVVRETVQTKALQSWCASRGLKIGSIITVETLPKTELGKIQRSSLLARLLKQAGSN